MKLKKESNLFQGLKNSQVDASTLHLLYKRPSGDLYVRIHNVPDTLSGDSLCLRANIPSLSSHSAINGNIISEIPMMTFDNDDYLKEDTHDIVAELPLVTFDEQIHFAKRSKFRSEVPNLKIAVELPHIVRILGRTEDGQIVFPKLVDAIRLAIRLNYGCRFRASPPPTCPGTHWAALHRYMSS